MAAASMTPDDLIRTIHEVDIYRDECPCGTCKRKNGTKPALIKVIELCKEADRFQTVRDRAHLSISVECLLKTIEGEF